MPLTQSEFDQLSVLLHRITVPNPENAAVQPVRLDALASLARTAERVLTLFERAIMRTMQEGGGAEEPATGEQVTGEQPVPKKRGPKPKQAQPEGTTPPAAAPSPAPTVASGVGNGKQMPQADPLNDDIPDFLDRRPQGQQPAAADDDPFGEKATPTQEAAPAPKTLTAQDVKDVLKAYMEKHGADGSAKLTALIESVGGVKHFSKLDPVKWPEIVAKAQAARR